MSNFDGHDLKEQIRSATDIVDLIGASLELRRQGRGFAGLCPFHNDSKPSLTVNPERQSWRCFVCDLGGDVFSYVMKREGVDFRGALEMLAERAGIVLQKHGPVAEIGSPNHKPTLYRAMAWAERLYHDCLKKDPLAEEARKYFADRGFNEESIQSFRLGFAPGGWGWLMDQVAESPFTPEIMEAVGLARRSEKSDRMYDAYRERVIFTIRDTQNRSIGLGGRIMPGSDDPAKYINSPETRLFSKSEHVYGLDLARDAIVADRHAIIVEGYTDVIMAHQYGVKNVVACLGTALGPRHIKLLRRFADKVTLVLDGDDAGQRRTNEVLEMFVASPLDLRVAALPDGKDPFDFVQENGGDAFNELVNSARDALTYKIEIAQRELRPDSSVHENNAALDDVLKTVSAAALNDRDASNPYKLRMDQVILRIARDFQVPDALVRERLRELRKSKRVIAVPDEPKEERLPPLHSWDNELFWLLFKHPELVSLAMEQFDPSQLNSEQATEIWNAIRAVMDRGLEPEFSRVLDAVEDVRLKTMIVEVDEARIQPPPEPQDCLLKLIEAYRSQVTKAAMNREVAALQSPSMDEEEQLDAFAKILNEQRKRHGISVPTDG